MERPTFGSALVTMIILGVAMFFVALKMYNAYLNHDATPAALWGSLALSLICWINPMVVEMKMSATWLTGLVIFYLIAYRIVYKTKKKLWLQ